MLTLTDFQLAQHRIQGVALRTPLWPYVPEAAGRRLHLKLENFQPIGAFKLRGAYNAIASLSTEERQRGVITHSSGNHAQAVAYAARTLGVRAVVVMPQNAPRLKKEKTAGYGAEVVLVGNSSAERIAVAEALAAERGLVLVPPYNDENVIAGQGTIGLEILDALPEVELALVPVSGGGLISGVAAALKLSRAPLRAGRGLSKRKRSPETPAVRVIGVEPEFAGDAQASLRSGQRVSFTAEQVARTAADGLRVQTLGTLTWPYVKTYVDDIVTVSEDEIFAAMRRLACEAHIVAEPSGAVAFAAWHYHRSELPDVRNSVAIISGGNVEPQFLAEILGGTPADLASS